MFEVLISALPIKGDIRKVSIPAPSDDEILIKVVIAGSNPKDWKFPKRSGRAMNSGDDMAGIVQSVGDAVYEFKPGDRVAAFHKMGKPHGAYAEYAIAPASTTFLLPPHVSFEEGATIPLAAMTAALALYQNLRLPTPWCPVPEGKKCPIVIYGGASAVGAYALKLAKLSKLNPIITVAGNGIDFVRSMDIAHHIIDYRQEDVESQIKQALEGEELLHAFDAICSNESCKSLACVLSTCSTSYLNLVDLPNDIQSIPSNIELSRTFVASAYGEAHKWRNECEASKDREFSYLFYRYIGLLLQDGHFSGHPYEIRPRGLLGVAEGIELLHSGKVSAKKLVYRISDTPFDDRHTTP